MVLNHGLEIFVPTTSTFENNGIISDDVFKIFDNYFWSMVSNYHLLIFGRFKNFVDFVYFRKSIIATNLWKFLNSDHASKKLNWTTELIQAYRYLFRDTLNSLFTVFNTIKSILGSRTQPSPKHPPLAEPRNFRNTQKPW